MLKILPSLTAVVELSAIELLLATAMALTAMVLTVAVVVMITFLFCRALPSIAEHPSYGRGKDRKDPPPP